MQYVNPSINWGLNKLDVNTHTLKAPIKPSPNSNYLFVSPRARGPVDSDLHQEKSGVSLISIVAYACIYRTRGSMVFQLTIRDLDTICNHLTRVGETETDMSQVSNDYHEFADVFSI